jgi:hypothetical protein
MIKEDLVFQQLEDEALGELYDMQQRMHSALAPAFFENEFKDEVGRAWKAHDRVGRLSLPWYKWGPEKSLAEAYRAMVESRKDPAVRAQLARSHADLAKRVDEGRKTAQAISTFTKLQRERQAEVQAMMRRRNSG